VAGFRPNALRQLADVLPIGFGARTDTRSSFHHMVWPSAVTGGCLARTIRKWRTGGANFLFRRGTPGSVSVMPGILVGQIPEQRPYGLPDEAGSGPVMTEHLEFVAGEPVPPFPGIGVHWDRNSVQPVVEEADRYVERPGDPAQLAGADRTRPALVFLHLLERQSQGLAEFRLGQAQQGAAEADPLADVLVGQLRGARVPGLAPALHIGLAVLGLHPHSIPRHENRTRSNLRRENG
jgi:hypothetical protein